MWNTGFIVMEKHIPASLSQFSLGSISVAFKVSIGQKLLKGLLRNLHALIVLRKDKGYDFPSAQDWARLTHLSAKLADFLHSSFPGFHA
jgi:hypothetical protein